MPRLRERTSDELAAEASLIAWEQFVDRTMWRRNHKGSYVREWEGATLTIFHRAGYWRWCIAGADDPRFSAQVCETADEAIVELADALGVGW